MPQKTRRDIVPHSTSDRTSSTLDGLDKPQETGKIFESLHEQLAKTSFQTQTKSPRFSVSLDILPDEVLLRIFDFYRMVHIHKLSEWRDLLLVCRRWYQLIVSSPRRLYLYVLCTRKTSFRKNLGHWPTFPIIIDYVNYPNYNTQKCSPRRSLCRTRAP